MADTAELRRVEAGLLARVSSENLMEYTRRIAAQVRLSGTPEELDAFRYVQSVLDGFGYKTRLILHDAYISLPGAAELTVLGPDGGPVTCITHAMAGSTPPNGLEGKVVYAGDGSQATLDGLNLKGKIALLDGLANPEKTVRVEAAGAIAQINICDDNLHEMILSPVWGSPTHESAGRLPSRPAVSVVEGDGQRLKDRLEQGPLWVRLRTSVDTGWRKTPLLVADLAGQEDRFVLFSGHIDSWHYGATDNGTANACQIEVARILAENRHLMRRGLRLCFWSGHSHGRYSGSQWYADQFWFDIRDRCAAHVNADTLGGRGAVSLEDVPAMAEAQDLAADVVRQVTGQEIARRPMRRAGDQSFWGIGVTSIFLSLSRVPTNADSVIAKMASAMGGQRVAEKGGAMPWWWHTVHDTMDKIDPEALVRDTQIYVATVLRLVAEPVLPLDFTDTAAQIRRCLRDLDAKLAGRFDLGPALDWSEQLASVCARLQATAEEATSAGNGAKAEAVNRSLMALGRIVIPLLYTRAGRFEHDPALNVGLLPALRPVEELAALPPDSDAFKFRAVALVRTRNEVAATLREAARCVEEALQV